MLNVANVASVASTNYQYQFRWCVINLRKVREVSEVFYFEIFPHIILNFSMGIFLGRINKFNKIYAAIRILPILSKLVVTELVP